MASGNTPGRVVGASNRELTAIKRMLLIRRAAETLAGSSAGS
jgi:hypothetical protein